jgi:hypothetical protein
VSRRTTLYFLICLLLVQFITQNGTNEFPDHEIPDETSVPILNSPNTITNQSTLDNTGKTFFKLQSFQVPSILFIVNDETSLDSIYDVSFHTYMSVDLGFNVDYHTANNSYNYSNYDVVVISRTVAETGTIDSLVDAPIPILTMEPGHGGEFGLGMGTYGVKWFQNVEIPEPTDVASSINHYIVENEIPGSVKQIFSDYPYSDHLKGFTIGSYPSGCEVVRLAYGGDAKYANIAALDKNQLNWILQPAPERRIFWGMSETESYISTTWDWWKKTLYWTLYDDFAGNATINVNVQDLDGNNIADAIVNVTDSVESKFSWVQNTSVLGISSFSNTPWGKYNIEVIYKSNTNSTLTNLEIVPTRTYMESMTYNYSVVIENYLDEDPPLITNINFNKTTTTFFADITDFSDLSFVYLNLTAHNLTTGATEIALQNFTMNHYSGITYYNATSLDSLTGSFVNITYNIIAEDSIGYSTASPVRHFDLDDPEAPIVLSYNAVDYGNSSIRFVSNITDTSGIQSPVILQVDSEYYEMYQNGSGFWIYNGFFDYDVALDFTIFSVYDQVGNENGSNIQPLSFPFKSITPSDFTSPRISALSDSFSDHEQGYVEFDVNIDDWNMYQSGVNASSVDIILEINGFNITLNITQIGEITFSYEYTFNYNDSVNYWIKAMDFADNVVYSLKRGPFLINDNTIPNINFWANEYGNGTIDFFTTVNDWPNNDTIAFILFTGDYFATEWMNYSMTPLSESQFWYRYEDFPYQPQDVWYYGTAFDSANNTLETPLDSAKSISLTDSVAPTITLTLINSTINDGEVTVRARAIDKYGTQIFVNNTFYINISTSSGLFSGLMAYDPSFYPFSTYNHTFSYPYQEEITITVWVSDLYGNLGLINKTILIQDEAPPTIVDHGISDFQNGTIIIWVEVFEGINGSGLYADIWYGMGQEIISGIKLLIENQGML